MPRTYTKSQPQYYIRMNIDGHWYFLWKVLQRPSRPIWWEESERGDKTPNLYKTLVFARNSLDKFVSSQALKSEVAVWKDEHANA